MVSALNRPEQWLSLFGAALILTAYALTVARPAWRRLYFSLSGAGAVALFMVGLIYHNMGILLLEVTWFALNMWGLWRAFHSRRTA